MLRTVIERAGFKQLLDGVQQSEQGLASIPSSIRHFQVESFKERPVQAEIAEKLLLPREDERWTSCVLVHGMGGTGKVSGLTVLSFVFSDRF